MNWLKKHITSDSQKPQPSFLQAQNGRNSSNGNSDNNGPFSRFANRGSNQLFKHVDTRKMMFETCTPPECPCKDPPPTDIPIKIASVTLLGDVRSLTTNMVRDLGFGGQIGQHILLSYGDTLYTDSTLDTSTFKGMTSNSVAFATESPCHVVDSNLHLDKKAYGYGWPEQFVKLRKEWGEDMSTHAVGITNVVETDAENGEGIIYTLLNHRPDGTDHIVGAGIAKVKINHHNVNGSCGQPIPVPQAERVSPFIWDGETEPWYGDCGAVRTQDYIYSYGHKKDNPWVYLARVKVADVLDVNCYEYWHGAAKGWRTERLKGDAVREDESVFWQVNQGQVVWNEYFKKFLFIYCDRFWDSMLILRSASLPEGPWSDTMDIQKIEPITQGGTIYAAAPQPHFDPSGKTLVITYTNHPNRVQGVRVEFE